MAKKRARCDGIDRRDGARGPSRRTRARSSPGSPTSDRMCHGIWLPSPRRYFVPAGDRDHRANTAWISGFRYRTGYGRAALPAGAGRTSSPAGGWPSTARSTVRWASVRAPTAATAAASSSAAGGCGSWRRTSSGWSTPCSGSSVVERPAGMAASSPRSAGSSIVADGDRIGLVPFQTSGRCAHLLVLHQAPAQAGRARPRLRSDGRQQLGAVASTRVPRFVQGATLDAAGRLYLARSNLACGELVTPSGRRIAFIPGAEGIQFASQRQAAVGGERVRRPAVRDLAQAVHPRCRELRVAPPAPWRAVHLPVPAPATCFGVSRHVADASQRQNNPVSRSRRTTPDTNSKPQDVTSTCAPTSPARAAGPSPPSRS